MRGRHHRIERPHRHRARAPACRPTATTSSGWCAGRSPPGESARALGSGRRHHRRRRPGRGRRASSTWPAPGIGDKRWTDERKRELVESRTHGTALLAATLAALDARPSVLVSGSAIGYYGDRGDEVLTESSGPGDDLLARLCVDWEAAAAPAADAGIRVATIRTGIVLDRRRRRAAQAAAAVQARPRRADRIGPQWWSWITLDDEIDAIVWLLTHDVPGPVNLTAPGAGDQRRAHQGPRPRAAPARRSCRSRSSAPAWWSAASWPRRCCSPASGCNRPR